MIKKSAVPIDAYNSKNCVKTVILHSKEDSGNSYNKINQAKCPEVFLLLVLLIASQALKQQL